MLINRRDYCIDMLHSEIKHSVVHWIYNFVSDKTYKLWLQWVTIDDVNQTETALSLIHI